MSEDDVESAPDPRLALGFALLRDLAVVFHRYGVQPVAFEYRSSETGEVVRCDLTMVAPLDSKLN